MKKFNKIISIFMLMIILLSSIQGVVLGVTNISSANLKKGSNIKTNVQYNDGKQKFEIEAKYIYYTNNGKKYPAYCISHGLDGVDERGNYTVDINEFLSEAKNVKYKERIWRVISNGYPYKKLEGLSDYEAYFATKQAIYCVIIPRSTSVYKGLNEQGKKVVNAIKALTAKGMDESIKPAQANLKVNKDGSFVEDGNYYSQTYTVNSSVNIGSFKVEKLSELPEGSFISDIKGNKKTSFENGEKAFKVMVPKEKLDKDINGTITITAKCETYPVLVGKTRIANTQDYAITCDKYQEFKTTIGLKVNTNTGKIAVKKIDSQTEKPLEGVEFELLKDGEKIATSKTNKQGILEFCNLYQGEYELKETATGNNYILGSESFNVKVEYNNQTTKDITNEFKKGKLIIHKVDKDNNKIPLENVVFDLFSYEFNKVIGTYVTDENGEIIIDNLRIGDYKLIEKDAGKWYEVAEDTNVTIKWNDTTEAIIQNEPKKGQVKVIKVDSKNKEVRIPNVEFEILDKNGKVLETIVTDANGEALTSKYAIKDFEEIKLHETKTGKNYNLENKILTIKLKENEITEVIFENTKKEVPKKLPKTGF